MRLAQVVRELLRNTNEWRRKDLSSELKVRDGTQTDPAVSSRICPTCDNDFHELSDHGFQNHVEWCRIVVGVPNARVNR